MHSQTLQDTVTNVRDFVLAELEANHAQAVNLIINGSSNLNSKLKQLRNMNHFQNQSCPSLLLLSNQPWQQEIHVCHNFSSSKLSTQPSTISTELPTYDTTANLLTTNLSAFSTYCLSIAVSTHLLAAASDNLLAPTNSTTVTKLTSKWKPKAKTDTTKLEIVNGSTEYTQNPNFQNYLSLLITPEDATFNKSEVNQKPFTNNILPATITEDKSLTAIFFFEFKKPIEMPLFSEVTLESKSITVIYTNAKVAGQHIKLILDSESAGIDHAASIRIITADRATKTLISEIDNFLFEVNNIIILIKILVMEATQYQALVGNNWLLKANTNGHHTCVPATCDYFKTTLNDKPLIELKEKKRKPT
ncbi:hypothetical protein G9A89_018731 [Geosiphon pyriformis]|nr:hypothetical protein G9A89_018731 [Geosiphon pyriformis]